MSGDIITDDTMRALKVAIGCGVALLLALGAAIGAIIYRAAAG